VGDGDAALLLLGVLVLFYGFADAAGEVGLADEGGLGAEGVEVEVEGEGAEGLAGEVLVGEGLGGVEGFLIGVELGLNVVGDDSGGEGFAVGGVGGDALGLRG
jgi:hypothetical protein